jgi:hypothetical protein
MQIVINISKKDYDDILNGEIKVSVLNWLIFNAIRDGIPLPKEHGRLIDENALKKYISDCDCCIGCKNQGYGCAAECKFPDYLDEDMERMINSQPTIIEANTESK